MPEGYMPHLLDYMIFLTFFKKCHSLVKCQSFKQVRKELWENRVIFETYWSVELLDSLPFMGPSEPQGPQPLFRRFDEFSSLKIK